MEELSHMLNGKGVYGIPLRTLPSLKFLAFITLCPDCDTHSNTANANAANVGTKGKVTKEAALKSTLTLRNTCETQLLRCRAHSRAAEKNFETIFKMEVMPEFAVHHAIHLLVFRPETPCDGLDSNDNESIENDKMLRKRLIWLFDPLVKSLGESADNISFLLRLSEMLGRSYIPRDCGMFENGHCTDDFSISSTLSNHENLLQSKLKVICAAAREVLMKYVKKDVNLTPYPGIIQINASLFAQNKGGSPTTPINIHEHDEDSESTEEDIAERTTVTDSGKKSEPSFSQSVASTTKLSSSKKDLDELQLSPILKPASPEFRIVKTPASDEMRGKVSFESVPSTESVDKKRGQTLTASKDKRRRTSANKKTSTRESPRRPKTKVDNTNVGGSYSNNKSSTNPTKEIELNFSNKEEVSVAKPKKTKDPVRMKGGKKSVKKTPTKVGKSSKPSKRAAESPASIGSRSTRSTRSKQYSTAESPQSSTTSVRRSSRLSRD